MDLQNKNKMIKKLAGFVAVAGSCTFLLTSPGLAQSTTGGTQAPDSSSSPNSNPDRSTGGTGPTSTPGSTPTSTPGTTNTGGTGSTGTTTDGTTNTGGTGSTGTTTDGTTNTGGTGSTGTTTDGTTNTGGTGSTPTSTPGTTNTGNTNSTGATNYRVGQVTTLVQCGPNGAARVVYKPQVGCYVLRANTPPLQAFNGDGYSQTSSNTTQQEPSSNMNGTTSPGSTTEPGSDTQGPNAAPTTSPSQDNSGSSTPRQQIMFPSSAK